MRPSFGIFGSATLCQFALTCWLSVACSGTEFTSGATGGAAQQGGEAGAAQTGGKASGTAGSTSGGSTATATGGTASGGAPATGGAPSTSSISKEGLLLWLSADTGVTTTSGAVSKWQDLSDNHADATQVMAGARPRVVSAGGSLSMIEFDGQDDALALPEGFDDFSSGLSFFAVLEPLDDTECSSIVQLSAGPEMEDIDFGRQQNSVHYENGAPYVTGSADALPKGERKLVGVVHATSGEVELRVDGQYLTSATLELPKTLPRTANFIARTLYSNCSPLGARIGEIILYSRALASAERTHVETYLRQKWACCGG